jgi:hypothetical protein
MCEVIYVMLNILTIEMPARYLYQQVTSVKIVCNAGTFWKTS